MFFRTFSSSCYIKLFGSVALKLHNYGPRRTNLSGSRSQETILSLAINCTLLEKPKNLGFVAQWKLVQKKHSGGANEKYSRREGIRNKEKYKPTQM